nr:His/Gly/Thr/Pro-type tRNA ligase C-terminal domain-containing protein [Paenibacillus oenotherae]
MIGIPIRITVGKQSKEGLVEYRERGSTELAIISAAAAVAKVTRDYAHMNKNGGGGNE